MDTHLMWIIAVLGALTLGPRPLPDCARKLCKFFHTPEKFTYPA